MDQILFIAFSILGGAVMGYIFHWVFTARSLRRQTPNVGEEEEEQEEPSTSLFTGKMNTSVLRKVAFSPECCDNESVNFAKRASENVENGDDQNSYDDTDEEQMPQFNERKLKKPVDDDDTPADQGDGKTEENKEKKPAMSMSEADEFNATLKNLHGKLATAQLKAQTRQMAAEMSQEEKEYETQIKNHQMANIMKLMMDNQEKFGMSSEDIKEQLNLYNF